jgi:hypothetical protein
MGKRHMKGGAGNAPINYVNPQAFVQGAGANPINMSYNGMVARPALNMIGGSCGCMQQQMGGRRASRKQNGGGCGCGGLSPRFLTGGARTLKKHRGGFSPAIMGPVIDNFKFVAPAVALATYRYYNQSIKHKKSRRKTQRRRTHRRRTAARK